jgi:hypothetical protein
MSSNKSNYVQLKNYQDFDKGCPNKDPYQTYDKYQQLMKQQLKENYISLSGSVRYPWSSCHEGPQCDIMGVS